MVGNLRAYLSLKSPPRSVVSVNHENGFVKHGKLEDDRSNLDGLSRSTDSLHLLQPPTACIINPFLGNAPCEMRISSDSFLSMTLSPGNETMHS